MVSRNKGVSSNANSIPSPNTYLPPTQSHVRARANRRGAVKGRGKEVYGLLYLGEKVAPERVTESSCLERIGAGDTSELSKWK